MEQPQSSRLPANEDFFRGKEVTFKLNGIAKSAYLGESVATVLLAEGINAMRVTTQGQGRGVYCGMGVCFDCLISQPPSTQSVAESLTNKGVSTPIASLTI